MILNDFRGKAVIVTGGTAGIGLATGLAFGRLGAHAYLTHRWGTADEDEIRARFAEAGAPEPAIVEADASLEDDTKALVELVERDHEGVEVLVSNVSFAHVSKHHEDLRRKAFQRGLKYSAWPFVGYLQEIRRVFERYPRYAIGISSIGPSYYLPGYDFVAAAKTVMEVYCRYLTTDLLKEDIRINILRGNPVETASLDATFGPEFVPFCKKYHGEDFFVGTDEFARAAVALASGLMDGVKGQIILLDHGVGFDDNVVRLYSERERYGLTID